MDHLKDLLQKLPDRLFQLLTGSVLAELLTVEFPSVRMQIPDLVGRLADGRIVHLELRTKNEAGLLWRVHGYYSLLREAFPEVEILQIILYVGAAPMSIPGLLEDGPLRFSCRVVDMRSLEAEPLLASASIEDNVLAVLCHLRDAPEALHRIVERMTPLGPKERADLAEKLLILCGLRGLAAAARKELELVPIEIDLMENEVFREVIEDLTRKRVDEAVTKAVSEAVDKAKQEAAGELHQAVTIGEHTGEARILRH